METMLRTPCGLRPRRYGLAFGIAVGLFAADEGMAWSRNSIGHSEGGVALSLTVGDTSPPSFRRPPVLEGVVTRYLMDPRGEVEGLMLQDGSQMHITSRASDKLRGAIKPGDHVRVHGRRLDGTPLVQADVIFNASNGTIFTVPFRLDFPVPEQEHHLSMTEMKAEGTIEVLLFHAVKSIVHGMLLSDGTQVRLPPDVSEELRRSFRLGEHLVVEGNGTANEYGRCLEVLSMSLNGGKMTSLDRAVTRLP
jgi:hypothetical protein